uniref:Calcitonin n=1 Tax=Prolemur simus TaxID=1328070 RepID=A0A8C9DSI9_PROSS
MGFQKFSLFLALSTLLTACIGFASLPRSTLESIPELATLSEEQLRYLLAALVQDYVQMKAGNPAQGLETEGYSLDTYMQDKYMQDNNKFDTFPQTVTGAGGPGKKWDMASNLERDQCPHFGIPQQGH